MIGITFRSNFARTYNERVSFHTFCDGLCIIGCAFESGKQIFIIFLNRKRERERGSARIEK